MPKMKDKPKRKPLPEFLTVAEVCESLKVTRWTVKRMIERGDFESKKFGNNIRILRESFEQYIENAS